MKTNLKSKVTSLIAILALAAVPALALAAPTHATGHVTAYAAHTAMFHPAGEYRASRPVDPVLLFNPIDDQPLR